MSYRLVYTQRASADIKKLDRVARKRLAKKLLLLRDNPFRMSRKLIHPKLGEYRYRVGNYRVIFDFKGNDIVILRVGHRREIYR